jgi:hypothetical protein
MPSTTDRTPTPYRLARAHADSVLETFQAKISPDLHHELQAVIDADSLAVEEWTLLNLAQLGRHLPSVAAAIPHIWADIVVGRYPDGGTTCTLCLADPDGAS